MLTNYYIWNPESSSYKEIINQSFRKKDIRTIQLFDKENLYAKNFLLYNMLTYPSGVSTQNKIHTIPLSSSLKLKSNYKLFLKKRFIMHDFFRKPSLLQQRRSHLLKNRIHRKMRFFPVHFLRDHRSQKLFRMRYKRLFSILSKIFIKDNLGDRIGALLKYRVLHKHLSKIANKKRV